MNRFVTDTQCLLWFFARDRRLPTGARNVFMETKEDRAQILVPSIVLVETLFLLQRSRVKESVVTEIMAIPEEPSSSLFVVPLDLRVVRVMRDFGPTAVPELADRIIAATARAYSLPLITTDSAIIESKLVQVLE